MDWVDVVDPLARLGIWEKLTIPHAVHPFGVHTAGLHHFAPFGDALAYGQLAIAKASTTLFILKPTQTMADSCYEFIIR